MFPISTDETDYIATSAEFLFQGAPQQLCALINITDDGRSEPTESFLVILNTTRTSQTVSLNPQFVFVTITDEDDCELTAYVTVLDRNRILFRNANIEINVIENASLHCSLAHTVQQLETWDKL